MFKVGEHENMAPIPKNFPKCNNYYNNFEDIVVDNEIAKQTEVTTDAPRGTESKSNENSMDTHKKTVLREFSDRNESLNSKAPGTYRGKNYNRLLSHINETNNEGLVSFMNKTQLANSDSSLGVFADSVYEENKFKDKVKYNIQHNDKNKNINTNHLNNGLGDNAASTSIFNIAIPKSSNQEENDLKVIQDDLLGIPSNALHSALSNALNSTDTKDTNDIRSRWDRSTLNQGGSNYGSVMMRSASLIAGATCIVILLIAIVFALYKAC